MSEVPQHVYIDYASSNSWVQVVLRASWNCDDDDRTGQSSEFRVRHFSIASFDFDEDGV